MLIICLHFITHVRCLVLSKIAKHFRISLVLHSWALLYRLPRNVKPFLVWFKAVSHDSLRLHRVTFPDPIFITGISVFAYGLCGIAMSQRNNATQQKACLLKLFYALLFHPDSDSVGLSHILLFAFQQQCIIYTKRLGLGSLRV